MCIRDRKALSPAKVKEVRIIEETGTAEVIVPDFQLSLAIGKEGQNARLAARLTGWRVDIKSETQLAQEEAYGDVEWAEGEWVVDPESGEQVWKPADGGEAISAEDWNESADGEEEAPSEDGDDSLTEDNDSLTEVSADSDPVVTDATSEEE